MDYDNLLGYLEVTGKGGPRRSAQSSYADLQKIRRSSNAQPIALTTAVVPNPVLDDDGLHVRTGPRGTRNRKMSLSDGVAVERISEVDRRESFSDATREINEEILEQKLTASAVQDGDDHVHRE